MRMKKIVVIGSLNMDLVANTKHMPKIGETIIGLDFKQIHGGKGANQAVAIARLGGNVSMIGKVGNDNFGENLLKALTEDKVETNHIMKENVSSTGIALITVDEKANNTIIVIPGANYKVTQEEIHEKLELIGEVDVLVTQLEIPIDVVKYSLRRAKDKGVFTILNPAPAQLLDDEIISSVDLLIPNETELQILSGIEIQSEEELLEACSKLIKKGVKELIVTLGDKGSIYFTENEYKKFTAYKANAVDTTAAGDSFVAAIAVGLTNNFKIEKAIDFASKVGALTVSKHGAQSSLPFLQEVMNFEEDYNEKRYID